MVNGNDAPGADISVESAVGLFEEFPPHFRFHKQRSLGAPVIVGQNGDRAENVNQQLGVENPVFRNGFNLGMHFLRVLVEIGQRVLKAHEEVALLKNTRTHKGGE